MLEAGVNWAILATGSTDIPTSAVVELTLPNESNMASPKGLMAVCVGRTFDILKIALGFSLDMNPKYCQAILPSSVERPK